MSVYAALALSSLMIIAWYGIRLKTAISKQGLDPSLVTYLSPLNTRNYWTGRICTAAVLIISVAAPAFNLLAVSLLMFAGLQVALLLIFRRGATQPLVYYMSMAIIGLIALVSASLLILAASLFVAQEIYLAHWQKGRKHRYRKWVARETIKIHHRHQPLAATMTKKEWFHVLHFATTESIARPVVVRWLERLFFYWKRPAYISSGIMQVRSDRLLTDAESMREGSLLITEALRRLPDGLTDPGEQLKWLAKTYNGSTTYSRYLLYTYPGVSEAWQTIDRS